MPHFVETGLIAGIEQLVVPPRQLALWSLGQSGFVIKGSSTIAYIDPYLSDWVLQSVHGGVFPFQLIQLRFSMRTRSLRHMSIWTMQMGQHLALSWPRHRKPS